MNTTLCANEDTSVGGDEHKSSTLEAEVPVPERPISKVVSKQRWNRLKLSQQIGFLLFLNRIGELTEGGQQRLLYLQAKASFEALEAGIRWCQRLISRPKLQSDFKVELIEANRRPQSKRFRRAEKRRIGIGYRDKGHLPELTDVARRKSIEEAFVHLSTVEEMLESLQYYLPSEAVEGDWVDLSYVYALFGHQPLSGTSSSSLLS